MDGSDDALRLEDLPGFGALDADLQVLLRRAEAGDETVRPDVLRRVADVVNVFIGLDLLQFVFMPAPDADAGEPIAIDLVEPAAADSAAVAWFAIDEAGYDEFRDAVTLFGDVTDVLNPPIVLDAGEADAEPVVEED